MPNYSFCCRSERCSLLPVLSIVHWVLSSLIKVPEGKGVLFPSLNYVQWDVSYLSNSRNWAYWIQSSSKSDTPYSFNIYGPLHNELQFLTISHLLLFINLLSFNCTLYSLRRTKCRLFDVYIRLPNDVHLFNSCGWE